MLTFCIVWYGICVGGGKATIFFLGRVAKT